MSSAIVSASVHIILSASLVNSDDSGEGRDTVAGVCRSANEIAIEEEKFDVRPVGAESRVEIFACLGRDGGLVELFKTWYGGISLNIVTRGEWLLYRVGRLHSWFVRPCGPCYNLVLIVDQGGIDGKLSVGS